jgi:regulator of nucleoside diphosphate kinase
MQTLQARRILVTRTDRDRLQRVIEARRGAYRRDQAHVDALEKELDRADVVEVRKIPSNVVTMHSRVRVRDVNSGAEAVYTLAYPNEVGAGDGRLSVLAPIGTALLGYRQGDVIEWQVPGGVRTIEVTEVLYQPEAAAAAARRGTPARAAASEV